MMVFRWLVVSMVLVLPMMWADESPGHPPPDRFASSIISFIREDRGAMPSRGGVLFIGSSSVRLWNELTEHFPDYNVINRGFGGSLINDSLHYSDLIILPYEPSVIVFYAGENDVWEGLGPEIVAEDFQKLVKLVHSKLPATRIGFVSMKPSPQRVEMLEQLRAGNDLIRDFAEETDNVDYIDVFFSMLDGEGRPRKELFAADMLHLNEDGYLLWRELIGNYLEKVHTGTAARSEQQSEGVFHVNPVEHTD